MNSEEQSGAAGSAPEAPQNETQGASSAPRQNAQEDLKKLAGNAQAAAKDFDFNRMFEGRLDHMNYLYGIIAAIAIGAIVSYIPLINILVGLALTVVSLAMTARRFRDIGITGWASLALIILPIAPFVIIYLCWRHGDTATSIYGAAPDPKREMFRAILNT